MKKIRSILLIGMTLIFTAGCSFGSLKDLNTKKDDNTEIQDNVESEVTKPEENTPEQEVPTTPTTPSTSEEGGTNPDSKPTEDEKQNDPKPSEDEEKDDSKPSEDEKLNAQYIEEINKALEKTSSANSVYFTRKITGIISEDAKIKYNKSQNRRWYSNEKQKLEEYLEGFPDRYTNEFNPAKYFYQTYWHKNNETNAWERVGTIHASFAISELQFLNHIKEVKKLSSSSPYAGYVVTIDKENANTVAANVLNAPDLFKDDITVTVIIDRDNYIRGIDGNWKKDVLTNPNNGPITLSVHMGDFDNTNISRPKNLNDEPVNYPDTRDELTPTKKEAIKQDIYNAFQKTYKATTATYNRNGMSVSYDISKNAALMEYFDGTTTYYEGTPGNYVDYDYVASNYHQESWTKTSDSDVWTKNVKKHTCFIPRELYFLKTIFDVVKVEVEENMTTYTIVVLKQNANAAYSYAYDERSYSYEDEKNFTDNITFTVSIDNDGYVREINIDQEGYKLDLKIDKVNSTSVTKPENIK